MDKSSTMKQDQMSIAHELLHLKELMMQHSLTLAVAESLTSGNIQAVIGSISGASNFFEGGLTAYNIDQKVTILGINKDHAEQVNCVSSRVAREMAEGVCKRFGSAIGLATTGYAEPASDAEYPEPYAYFAIWHQLKDEGRVVKEGLVKLPDAGRVEVQEAVARTVVLALFDYLKSL